MATIDALRDLIYARDGGACGICGQPVERLKMTLDHIEPRAHGGADRVDNLRTAHGSCNSRRGAGREVVPQWAHVALRWPGDLRDCISESARANQRSINSEIIHRLSDPRNAVCRLAEWRAKRGLTLTELAHLANLTRVALARIESGQAQPRPKTTRALAKALGVGVEDLMEPLED